MNAHTRRHTALTLTAGLLLIVMMLTCCSAGMLGASSDVLPPATLAPSAPVPACDEAVAGDHTAGHSIVTTPPEAPRAPVDCLVQAERLVHWQEAGIRFEGPWRVEELTVVIDVLDHYEATYGETRFLALVQLALRMDPESTAQHLTFIRDARPAVAPGAWIPRLGEILINDTLYDQAYMDMNYRWVVLETSQYIAPSTVTIQQAVVAHELGHVLLDGIRVSQTTLEGSVESPEQVYTDRLNINYWPHPRSPVNENVATEVGLWALAVARPQAVVAFRDTYLAPYLQGALVMNLP